MVAGTAAVGVATATHEITWVAVVATLVRCALLLPRPPSA